MHVHVCRLIILMLIFGMQICTYYNFFFTILGGKNQGKEGSHFRDLSTWKKSKLGGFEKPYRVTNISWVDDISKSAFNFEMNIFLTQKKNCRFFFVFLAELRRSRTWLMI